MTALPSPALGGARARRDSVFFRAPWIFRTILLLRLESRRVFAVQQKHRRAPMPSLVSISGKTPISPERPTHHPWVPNLLSRKQLRQPTTHSFPSVSSLNQSLGPTGMRSAAASSVRMHAGRRTSRTAWMREAEGSLSNGNNLSTLSTFGEEKNEFI